MGHEFTEWHLQGVRQSEPGREAPHAVAQLQVDHSDATQACPLGQCLIRQS